MLERDTRLKREKQSGLTESEHHCTIVLLYSQTANCISRAGRILTRLKAMVPLTVRVPLLALSGHCPRGAFLLEERRRSQGLVQDPDRPTILRISSDNWSLSIRMRMQISKADQDRRFLKIPSFRYCGFHKSTVSFLGKNGPTSYRPVRITVGRGRRD